MSEVPQAPEATAAVVKEDHEDPSTEKEPQSEQPGAQLEDFADNAATPEADTQDVDAELEEMKKRLAQMEAESAGIKEGASNSPQAENPESNGVANSTIGGGDSGPGGKPEFTPSGPAHLSLSPDSVADADARSIYVGNVDYAATGDQLSSHFSDCGTINRVTIMCNKATGQPKGFAYIEFQDHLAAQNALILNESTFLGRALKIVPKRTNVPAAYRGGYGRGRPRYTRGSRGYSRRPRRSWRGRWAPY